MIMIMNKKIITQHECGLVLKDKQIQRVLEPGVYWFLGLRSKVDVVSTKPAEVTNMHLLDLIDSKSEKDKQICEKYLTVVDLKEYEVALVYQRNTLKSVLQAGQRHVYWKANDDLKIDIINTKDSIKIDSELAKVLVRKNGINGAVLAVYGVEIESEQLGLLTVDGELIDTLSAGVHAFWKLNRSVKVEHVELRLQSMEVAGQEILTKDKVSLRINLSANYKVIDAVKAKQAVKDYAEYLYRQLQFALRSAVGTQTLDSLLADKDALNSALFRSVEKRAEGIGLKVSDVGVKDIILPGEMKDILNHVVETEKAAQANVIRRREETAATRSLLNTAKLMDENPTLLRLKEIEALEKVVEKVDKISVYDGLNGLLRDTVKLA